MSCETQLEPILDDSEAFGSSFKTSRSFVRDVAILVATVIVGFLFWGVIVFAPGGLDQTESEPADVRAIDASNLIAKDENELIMRALQLDGDNSAALLLREKGCQRVAGEAIDAFDWRTISGETINSVDPAFPKNWNIHEVCPLEGGASAIATILDDGLALSRVSDRGDLDWTQIVSMPNPSEEHVILAQQDGMLILVSSGHSAGRVQVDAYASSGAANWKQTFMSAGGVETLRVAETSLGDLLIAWRDPREGIRLVILSGSGLVLDDDMIIDRLLPLKGVAQDEIGQTLLLFGDDHIEVDLLSQRGASERNAILANLARPLGVLTYEDEVFVFGTSQSNLFMWGIDDMGTISNRVNIELDAAIDAGSVHRMNAAEAMISLQTIDAGEFALGLDLRRLSNATLYEPSDSVFDPSAFPEPPRGGSTITETDQPSIATIREPETPTAGGEGTTEQISEQMETVPELPVSEVDASVASIEAEFPGDIDPLALAEADEQPAETVIEQDDVALSAPIEVPVADSLPVRCTFSCIASGEPSAEYVLMQSVERREGESSIDVSLRLNETHVNLCTLSGGAPEPSFKRECSPG